ncbi:hypothetical protein BKA93DRAFT_740422 [Sparassis latifolia]
MSFPAILRAPGISDRFAHLRTTADDLKEASFAPLAPKKSRRDDNEGKRWIRRKENARFVGNSHIVPPTKRDYAVPAPSIHATFPQPLPCYLSRNNAVPPAAIPAREAASANAGRFSLSLKGMRRELRKTGPRTELLVREVEGELLAWLRAGGVLLSPDAAAHMSFPGVRVGSTDAIREVARTPLQLVWWIVDHAFTRYVVHCCARYHDVVSFSKETSGKRLTYLLRPNVTRPNHGTAASLDTPPSTDLDSEFVSEFDLVSDHEVGTDSDADGPTSTPAEARVQSLSAIAEGPDASAPPSSELLPVPTYASDDAWSVIGDTDADAEDSEADAEAERGLPAAVSPLGLRDAGHAPRVRQVSLRAHVWERSRRSASSPSRSPARRTSSRVRPRVEPPRVEQPNAARSFYEYLFA